MPASLESIDVNALLAHVSLGEASRCRGGGVHRGAVSICRLGLGGLHGSLRGHGPRGLRKEGVSGTATRIKWGLSTGVGLREVRC